MFDTITVPAAVAAELKSVFLPDWVRVVSIPEGAIPHIKEATLGRGETEAIHLALHLRPERLLLDDGEGRREAQRLGLRVTGVLGLLVAAKRIGLLLKSCAATKKNYGWTAGRSGPIPCAQFILCTIQPLFWNLCSEPEYTEI